MHICILVIPDSNSIVHINMQAIDEDNLQENSAVVGTYFLERLQSLKEKHSCIGDVRGKGLMIGVELVNDRVSVCNVLKRCVSL